MRVQFDATLDDFVDVSQRSLKQSKEVGSQWSQDRVYSALLIGTALYFIVSSSLTTKMASAIIGGSCYFLIHPYIQRALIHRRLRRYCEEQLGRDFPIEIEVEVSEKGIWIKQQDTEILRDWEGVTAIEETEDSIDFFFTRGGLGLVVRKRGFVTEEEKNRFLNLANSYFQASRSSTE